MKNAPAVISRMAGALSLALLCAYALPAHAQEGQAATQSAPPVPDTASEAQGFIREPGGITRAVLFADRNLGGDGLSNGFYVETGRMIPGAGWISVGPGYRRWSHHDRLLLDGSAGLSWRGYKMAQARIELPKLAHSRLAIGSQVRWQDLAQVSFFGEGRETLADHRGEYRLRSSNLAGYATLRPVEWMGIGAQVGWLKPTILRRAGFFMRDRPDIRDLFPGDIVFSSLEQPTFVHSEASITTDTRDFPSHPTRGALLRAAAANYADRGAGVFSFKRYEGEAAGFVPLAGSRVVVAVHGWLVASDTGPGQVVPFYLQPSLGGNTLMRAYADYRFHDRHMAVVNVETRIAMMTHVDAAIFVDAGSVAARVADLNFDKRSYGAGLRLHSRRETFARLDVARGSEGWRFVFRMTDPLTLGRVTRRTAPVPFVP